MIETQPRKDTACHSTTERFDPSLRELFAIMWQRRGVAALAGVFVFICAFGVISYWQPAYRAVSEIGLSDSRNQILAKSTDSPVAPSGFLSAQEIETVIAEVKGEENLSTALAVLRGGEVTLNAPRERGVLGNVIGWLSGAGTPVDKPSDEASMAASLRAGLDLERVGNAAVIEIGFRSYDPAVAQHALQAIVESYVWQREDKQKRALRNQLSEARTQFETANRNLSGLEEELADWQRAAGVLDADENTRMLDRVYALDEQAEKLGQEVAQYRLIAKRRQSTMGLGELMAIPEIATHPSVARISGELEIKEQEFTALDQRYGPKHPIMQGRVDEIAQLRQELGTVVGNVSDQLDLELGTAEEKLRLITQQRAQWQTRIAERNSSMQGKSTLLREVSLARDAAAELGTRVRLLSQEMAAFQGDITILRSPSLPKAAEFPGKRDLMLLALMVSVFAAVSAALIRHYLDQSVQDDFDPEAHLGIPLYARIPVLEKHAKRSDSAGDEASGHLAVLMRILARKTGENHDQGNAQVIAICSAMTGDGKSYIARGLATKLAGMGASVLLLDADLHDSLTMAASEVGESNLTSVLGGECDVTDAISTDQHGGFDYLGSQLAVPGKIATGLIEAKLADVVAKLRDRFDHIIIDTPPILAVADGVVASRLADVTLFVLRCAHSQKRDVRQGLDQLRSAGVIPEGVVLNCAKPRPAYGQASPVTDRKEVPS